MSRSLFLLNVGKELKGVLFWVLACVSEELADANDVDGD